MIGRNIGRYQIREKLGEGGMGVVYRALDTMLDRTVALKVLAPHLVQRPEVRKRLVREAKACAALQHPNICTVFEIGEVDGVLFLAMACLEGRLLSDEIAAGPVPVDRALRLAGQWADGLGEAHSKGIVHRDIKPSNLFVTTRDDGVILDFGLAQLATSESTLTREGVTVGTLGYMSPEQTFGDAVDARTDVWAMGCVLYEMLAGRQPFRGTYDQAIVYSILNEDPEPIEGLARAIEKIVWKCLSKRAEDRYANGRELLAALGAGDRVSTPSSSGIAARPRPSILVLPFRDRGRDVEDEHFTDGVTEDVICTLGKLKGLRVISRSSAFQFKDKRPPLAELARSLRITHVLEGAIRQAGDRLRVTVELIEAEDGDQVWTERYDRVITDIFDIQDEIADAISEALVSTLVPVSATGRRRREPPNFEAYRYFLRGRQLNNSLQQDGMREAIDLFEKAIATDPNYLEARAGRAVALGMTGFMGWESPDNSTVKGREEALGILAIDPTIPEAHTAVGLAQCWRDWDFEAAEVSYRKAIEFAPSDPMPHSWLAHSLGEAGRIPEALEEAQRAVRLDPLNPIVNHTLTYLRQYDRDFEGVQQQGYKTLEIEPFYIPVMWAMASACYYTGQPEKMVELVDRAVEIAPDDPISLGVRGLWHGAAGHHEVALEQVEKLRRLREQHFCQVSPIIWCYIGIGDFEKLFEWCETAIETRDGLFPILRQFPFPDNERLQNDSRFLEIRRRAGLPLTPPKSVPEPAGKG